MRAVALASLIASVFFVFTTIYLLANHQRDPKAVSVQWTEPTVQATQIVPEEGGVIMGRLGNATIKAELGRSTWKLLHTMVARYPEKPSEEERAALRQFILLLARLYPCGECAEHFQTLLDRYPPQTSSRLAASSWACAIHNKVNERLQKPIFDCSTIMDKYPCGCNDEGPGAS